MNSRKSLSARVLGLVCLAGLAQVGQAQDAVGNGRALENNLITPRPPVVDPMNQNFARELMFRESIVTGNAPSGLSFRQAALPGRFEFRGELGEDDLFAYRRDSLYSGLASRGIRGTDALQYQMALTTGGQIPTTFAGSLSYARAGGEERGLYSPVERDLLNPEQGLRPAEPESLIPVIETGTALLQPVRSLSTYAADRGMQPTLVGVVQNRETRQSFGQTASPLLGVQQVPIDLLRRPVGFQEPAPETGASSGEAVETTPKATSAYEQLIARYREQAGLLAEPAPNEGMPEWARDIVSVHTFLRGLPPSTAQALGLAPTAEPGQGAEQGVAPGRLEERGIAGQVDPEQASPDSPIGRRAFEMSAIKRIRDAGSLTNSLVPTDLPRVDRYHAYMRGGQDLLAKGFYFDAEERFISAMASRPDDVTASVGRAHAQLGAGLYLSAAVNIRQLFFTHPEVAAMRYGPELLPDAARQAYLVGEFRKNLKSPLAGADCGLLLAYLGYQNGDTAQIREGLGALEEWGDESEDRLATMLRAVWLDEAPPVVEDSAPGEGAAPDPGAGDSGG